MPFIKYVLRDERTKVSKNSSDEFKLNAMWISMSNIFEYLGKLEDELEKRFENSLKSQLTVNQKRKKEEEELSKNRKLEELENEIAILKRENADLKTKIDDIYQTIGKERRKQYQINPIVQNR